MKVVTLSTSDLGHGAGIAAYRLHRALSVAGADATMLVTQKLSHDTSVIDLLPPVDGLKRVIRGGALVVERFLNISGPQNLYSVADRTLQRYLDALQPDVIHLHNLHWHSRNLSLSLVKRLGQRAPLVWTFHDMWPITGHCIYSRDCTRWISGCGGCPYVRAYMGQLVDTSWLQCRLKGYFYAKSSFTVVTPSKWLAASAATSPLLKKTRIVTIPNSVGLDTFFPRRKPACRESLGLDAKDRPVLLFVSAHLDNPLKGYQYFEAALWKLAPKWQHKLVVVIVGQGEVSSALKEIFPIVEMGFVNDPSSMSEIYAASDIYVMPSSYDNLPSVVLESFACCTPVVAFRTGGVPEMVRDGNTGLVADYLDVNDLARCIECLLLDEKKRNAMGQTARRLVEEEFSPAVQAQRCLALYQELLQANV